jgi:uncharacterized protein
MNYLQSIDELQAIYGTELAPAAVVKVANRVTPQYGQLIAASPFLVLATVGPEGLDCSPRGDQRGFVRVSDDGKTLWIPDRRGNNRIDSLRNIVRDPRVALLFLIPGSGTTLRVNGKALLTADVALCDSFAVEEKAPRCVIELRIDEIYFQCARAIVRSALWSQDSHLNAADIPTPGQILATMTANQVGGKTYDEEWPARAAKTMW